MLHKSYVLVSARRLHPHMYGMSRILRLGKGASFAHWKICKGAGVISHLVRLANMPEAPTGLSLADQSHRDEICM